MVNRKLKLRVRAMWPIDSKILCECGHPFYVHSTSGKCGECPVNPRTNKSRCRRFKSNLRKDTVR